MKLTNLSKTQLIQRLIVAVEQREVAWPAAWTVLTDEMKRYEYKITGTGAITYNAPSGYHDDCVIALALANSKRYAFEGSGDIRIITPPARMRFLRPASRRLLS